MSCKIKIIQITCHQVRTTLTEIFGMRSGYYKRESLSAKVKQNRNKPVSFKDYCTLDVKLYFCKVVNDDTMKTATEELYFMYKFE